MLISVYLRQPSNTVYRSDPGSNDYCREFVSSAFLFCFCIFSVSTAFYVMFWLFQIQCCAKDIFNVVKADKSWAILQIEKNIKIKVPC